ncbi:Cytochrome P450 [Glarea lozoyensis ATCC 20868]|uniref:Cytochrome P450 n=1 Tax=Glarea lozoyensis (strain ATCC 20868 / MF5171) TaxID=1116229 RepID=S3CJ40_GLAL2|nr:Cytochrome P450 [Glarea lozoyensis ATCC 20868]EPE26532.1 Cytochrome P450 [Glarea lozoyensis ATCC 20868]
MYPVFVAVASAAACILITLLWQKCTDFVAFNIKRRQTGCFRAKLYPHTDRLWGSDLVKQRQQATKNGNLQALYTRHFKMLAKTWEEVFWNQRVINTMDTANLQYVHVFGFEDFGKPNHRMKISAPILGNGIFVAEGARWKHSRSIIKPIFARAELENISSMAKHVDRFLNLLPQNSETFDIQPMLKKMVLDISTDFLFGESIDAQTPEGGPAAERFLQALDESLAGWHKRRLAGLGSVRYIFDKSWSSAYKQLYAFIDAHVNRALELVSSPQSDKNSTDPVENSSEKYILLYEMAKEIRDPIRLRFELINVFLPSRDTTAALLANTLFQLARHPEYWKQLRKTALSLPFDPTDHKQLSFSTLKSLTPFRYVIQETFRTIGPVGRVFRAARKDTMLPRGGGPDGKSPVFVAKGTTICSLPYHIHHDKDIWGDDADDFRPERWAEGNRKSWEYVPFLGGPRICPAQQQVLSQATYILLRLVLEFEWIENKDEVVEYVELQRMAIESRRGVIIALGPAKDCRT